jgi:O-acetyl-ADP-ribose deacetylase (regulator of RNase III)
MKIIFRDTNAAVVKAVAKLLPEWDTDDSDIFSVPEADFILSPANCAGRMDGGIDQIYLNRFGHQLEFRLMRYITAVRDGALPIGEAVAITTYDPAFPQMICAPTMAWPPRDVSKTENAKIAFLAALRCAAVVGAQTHPGREVALLTPGLCTLTGKMPAKVCAQQMRDAWDDFQAEKGRYAA